MFILQAESREQAINIMIKDAEKLGADAIVSFRNSGLRYSGKT